VTCRRPFRIWRFSPLYAGASPLRLAFAAGQVRLALRPGVSQGKWSNFPPAGSHFCSPAVSAPPGITFAFPLRGRSALRGAEAPRPYRRACRSGGLRLRFERAAPHLPRGGTPLPVGTAPRRRPLRATAEQETLREPPVGLPSCSGLAAGAAFRLRRPGPFQAIFPAFTDSRSGLTQQPNASVRVASR